MAFNKSTATVGGADTLGRVEWPDLPKLEALKPADQAALGQWYWQVQQSVQLALTGIVERVVNAT